MMNYGMYIVGGIIFALYMYFTLWNIVYNGNKQEQENKATIEHDSLDYDGMGNFTRMPISRERKKSLRIVEKNIKKDIRYDRQKD